MLLACNVLCLSEEARMSSWVRKKANALPVGAVAAVACAALLVPASAGAATVVNGDFETGSLSGWQTQSAGPSYNSWFAYSGTTSLISLHPIPSPPQGNFAAITDQNDPAGDIMYQDVTLEPYYTHQLTMTLYYKSYDPISIPSPDTLNWSGGPSESTLEQPNQQYRVDVMKPTAPVNSLNPSDILATVFATKAGDPETMGPTQFSLNLTAFAGQTVRLRFAVTDNHSYFNAGVDSVSIASTPPSNVFVLGKVSRNVKKGTGKLPVTVPGAGTVTVADVPGAGQGPRIKPVTLAAGAAGTLMVPLSPTKAGRKLLKEKHQLSLKLSIAFTPTGGIAATQTLAAKLRLKPKKHHKKHHRKH
jgi:hypothetical protein